MKKVSLLLFAAGIPVLSMAQGWPANYGGVMLQGFYWDSFTDTKWKNIEQQADELSQYFDLIWVPQSGKAQYSKSMGYDVLYYWDQNSSFGTESQLRSMISALKEKGTGVVADVVVNHRGNLSNWVDFPTETYNGETYQMLSTDIVRNDDNGATRTWAEQNGYSLSDNNDEGEGWDGMRDLDHKSENVQKSVKAYTKYLLDDLGYTGFRYDMVKGFAGSHVADYNMNAGVKYSVGEYWDGNPSKVKGWIDQTKVNDVPQSAAFDFPFRYTCRDAANGDWKKLKNTSLMSDEAYRQYSITFVENHDTEKRANNDQDPIRRDTLALNAWMLSMPGTPCVFLKHWQDWKTDIKNMIEVRRMVGISNLSTYEEFADNTNYCVRKVTGDNGQLAVAVGKYSNAVGYGFVEILSGYHYRLFVSKSLNTVWINTPSGVFAEGEKISAKISAITESADSQLVYTTDGTTPSATNGTKVASDTELTVEAGTTLLVGLLVNDEVVGIQKREYLVSQVEQPEQYDAWNLDVYVRSEAKDFDARMNFYIWAGEDDEQLNGNWPGKQITDLVEAGGYTWYVQSININRESMLPVNMVFSTGSGSPQTVDVTGLTSDSWFVIENTKEGGKYVVSDVTADYVGIDSVIVDTPSHDEQVYDLQGRRVNALRSGTFRIMSGRVIFIR